MGSSNTGKPDLLVVVTSVDVVLSLQRVDLSSIIDVVIAETEVLGTVSPVIHSSQIVNSIYSSSIVVPLCSKVSYSSVISVSVHTSVILQTSQVSKASISEVSQSSKVDVTSILVHATQILQSADLIIVPSHVDSLDSYLS